MEPHGGQNRGVPNAHLWVAGGALVLAALAEVLLALANALIRPADVSFGA